MAALESKQVCVPSDAHLTERTKSLCELRFFSDEQHCKQ